jgi:hypothetical protein
VEVTESGCTQTSSTSVARRLIVLFCLDATDRFTVPLTLAAGAMARSQTGGCSIALIDVMQSGKNRLADSQMRGELAVSELLDAPDASRS